ncbi:protein-export chaperone SecB [Fangia hongkongensis]|uniref:protein-export chaperone SecB n=1 Tax=Fangia hongkongensis TaxID=270495 RepID=UPI00035FDA0A|nr:protein-export chaperone SecB [Fangia hongkongensis]MBK2124633.1 protein-export chaperone SecB [Fangia hongkongensis]
MENTTENPQPNFVIQKIYTKDISFETPNTPEVFKSEWKPDANVNVNTQSNILEGNVHEVELTLTVTVKNADKTAYLIEVTQAGIFTIENMPQDQIDPMLGAFCPTSLFPYAKEVIDSLINKAGFPQINLAPINFDALYMQKAAQQNTADATQH